MLRSGRGGAGGPSRKLTYSGWQEGFWRFCRDSAGFSGKQKILQPVFGVFAPVYGVFAPVFGVFAPVFGVFARVFGVFARVFGVLAPVRGVLQAVRRPRVFIFPSGAAHFRFPDLGCRFLLVLLPTIFASFLSF